MKVQVPLTKTGLLPDRYGKYAPETAMYQGYPIISPPITVSDLPADTAYLALTLLDFDAVPISGFPWIHWLATNIPATSLIKENASQAQAATFIQGRNSNAGQVVQITDPKISQRYVGPQPPDQTHNYELTVYALAAPLPLQAGYWLNAFRRVLPQQQLAKTKIILPSRA